MPTTPTTAILLYTTNPSLKLLHDGMTSAILTLDTIGPLEGIQTDGSALWNLSALGEIQNHLGQVVAVISGHTYTMPLSVTISPPVPQTGPISTAFRMYRVTPQFAANTLPDPSTIYWGVKAQLRDASGNIVSESPESSLFQFLLDAEETGLVPNFGGPGGTSWAPLIQKDPLVPRKAFRLVSVLPFPGFVNQDVMPQSD